MAYSFLFYSFTLSSLKETGIYLQRVAGRPQSRADSRPPPAGQKWLLRSAQCAHALGPSSMPSLNASTVTLLIAVFPDILGKMLPAMD